MALLEVGDLCSAYNGVIALWDVSFSVIGNSGTVPLAGTGDITDGAVPAPFGATGWLGPLQNNGGPTLTHALLVSFEPQGVENCECGGKSNSENPGEIPHRRCSSQ